MDELLVGATDWHTFAHRRRTHSTSDLLFLRGHARGALAVLLVSDVLFIDADAAMHQGVLLNRASALATHLLQCWWKSHAIADHSTRSADTCSLASLTVGRI